MRWWSRLRRGPLGAASSATAARETPLAPWSRHLESAGLLTVALRLPRLLGEALARAWRADPRDTAASVLLHVAAGACTAFGLVALTGVLGELFAEGPAAERVAAALPDALLVGGAAAAGALLRAGAAWAQARLEPTLERAAERELFELTSRMRLEAFDDSELHDAMCRARDRGVQEVARMVGVAVDLLGGLIGLVAVAGVLGVLHPVLVALLVLTVLPEGWAAMRAAKLRYGRIRELTTQRRRQCVLGDLLAERAAAAELRAYAMRPMVLAEYAAFADGVRAAMLGVARRQAVVRLAGEAAGGAATLVAFAVLGVLLAAGHMPLAAAGTAALALRQGRSALGGVLQAANLCYECGLYYRDFLEFCGRARQELPPEVEGEVPGPLLRLDVRGVEFAYPGQGEPALRGVDLELRAGEVVALVGENGSGKSTLARLVAGLYAPGRGTIRWNGVDLSGIAPEQVRSRIGLISQDYTQWPMSARRNITMAEEGRTDPRRLEDALRGSGADAVVAGLRYGLDTLLDKRFAEGADLSGGQRQRIAAARGLYRATDLVIADEPTAALDATAEKRLFATLDALARRSAVLLITHRLTSVRRADRIYVLSRGRVAEQGTHAQLMARPRGLYRRMFADQTRIASPPSEPEDPSPGAPHYESTL